jgi:16S rRNA (guanine966-N2)-methyltransferase
MRVISGTSRGRKLVTPPGTDVRPTTDRVKEAWFSSIGPRIVGSAVLDLYAGSGALGIESASRGADRVVCVEDDPTALGAIEENIAATRLEVLAIRSDVGRAVGADGRTPHPALTARPFDLVLLDPPYAFDLDELAGVLAALPALLAPGAVVWLEAYRKADIGWPSTLRVLRERRYGDTVLHTAESADEAEEPA